MRRIKKRRRLVLCAGIAFVIFAGICCYYIYNAKIRADKIETGSMRSDDVESLYVGSGIGTGSAKDSFVIAEGGDTWGSWGLLDVFPGRGYIDCDFECNTTIMTNNIDGEHYRREKIEYEKMDAVLYDMQTGQEIRRFDLPELAKKACPDFQCRMLYDCKPREDGRDYLMIRLEDIPEKSTDELVEKYMIVDIDTEDVVIRDSIEEAYDFVEGDESEEEAKYGAEINGEDWRIPRKSGDIEPEIWGVRGSEGCVQISLSCTDLPEQNTLLYDRFPELEKWSGTAGKSVYIYVGGHPSIEDIYALLEEQGE